MPVIPINKISTIDTGRLTPTAGAITIPETPRAAYAEPAAFEAPATAMSMAISKLGEVGSRFAESMQKAERVTLYEKSKADTMRRLADFEGTLIGRRDFGNFEGEFNAVVQDIQQGYRNTIEDQAVVEALERELLPQALERQIKIKGLVAKGKIDDGRATYFATKTTYENLFGTANERERQQIVDDFTLSTIRNQQAGYLQAEEAEQQISHFLRKADNIRAEQDLRRDASKFTPDNYRNLAPEDRIQLSDHALRMVEADQKEKIRIQEKAERDEEKRVKQAQEDNARVFWSRIGGAAKEPISLQDVERANLKRQIPLDEYKAMKKVLTDEGEDDAQAKFLLFDRIERGVASRQEIFDLMEQKRIKGKTGFAALEKYYERGRADDISKNPEFKDAETYIKENLKTTGIMDKFDEAEASRQQFALDEFNTRVRNKEPIQAVRDDIVERYRPTPVSAASLPRPLFGSKTDIWTAYWRTQLAYHELHEIDYSTFQREILNLSRLQHIADRQNLAAQGPKAGGKINQEDFKKKIKERK